MAPTTSTRSMLPGAKAESWASDWTRITPSCGQPSPMAWSASPRVVKRMSCAVKGVAGCSLIAPPFTTVGPSPKRRQGRVPWMASPWRAIQAARPSSVWRSSESIVPSALSGTDSSRLPFFDTTSHRM